MKVLMVCDVKGWAIDKLVGAVKKYNPHHEIRVVYIGPRDAHDKAFEFLQTVEAFKPDLIEYNYFRTMTQLIDVFPQLKDYKTISVHHNQRNKALLHCDWNDYGVDLLVTHTDKGLKKLRDAGYENSIRTKSATNVKEFWYSDKEGKDDNVGYAGRVVPWKRLKEVAQACKDLEYTCKLMGRPDQPAYWDEVPKEALDFEFWEASDNDRVNFYHSLKCFVCFSDDDYEDGPLPVFEAMASGVPVITTPCGTAGEIIKHRENGMIVPFGDFEALKEAIKEVMENKELRQRLRKNAWETIKNFDEERRAYEYSKIWNKLLYPNEPLASVIVPIYKGEKRIGRILESIKNQIYKNIETIICNDDEPNEEIESIVKEYRKEGMTIKYFNTALYAINNLEGEAVKMNKEYGLARARNKGIIEAEGKYVVFSDDRLELENTAISVFVQALESTNDKIWLFGDKGAQKQTFVENFSAIKRQHIINAGMFCERINKYGGMSQEIRRRFGEQGGSTEYIGGAVASELKSSKRTRERRDEIVDMKFRLYKMGY